jgi:succinate-semialdehyde dehydrogenase/glutarate-semialdehyde dehydrogenase
VNAANEAFLSWRETGFPQRVEKLRNTVRILTDQKVEYAVLMASEMGKPVRAGQAEIEKCAWGYNYHFLK